MKCTTVIRDIMSAAGITQTDLAKKMGYKTQSGISNALSRENGIRTDVFVKMANALGYEVVIRRGKEEWVVTE